MDALTRKELFFGAMLGENEAPDPLTREEIFYAAMAGKDVAIPTPLTREEVFLKAFAEGGGGGTAPVITGTIANPFSIEVAEEIHAGCFLGMATKTATIYVPFFGRGYVPCAIFGQGTKDGSGGVRALLCGMGAFLGNITYGLVTLTYVLDSDASPYETLEAPMLSVRKALQITAGDTPAVQDMSAMLPETATTYTVISTSKGGIYPID